MQHLVRGMQLPTTTFSQGLQHSVLYFINMIVISLIYNYFTVPSSDCLTAWARLLRKSQFGLSGSQVSLHCLKNLEENVQIEGCIMVPFYC